MKVVRGIIEPSLANGRIDFDLEKPDGTKVSYRGVVLYDEKVEPIDFWHKAVGLMAWRAHLLAANKKLSDYDVLRAALTGEAEEEMKIPRVAVLEVSTPGGSRTTYVEPDDTVTMVRKHEP